VLLDGTEDRSASAAAPSPQGPPTWRLIAPSDEPPARGVA
jgi:hypothetical protein